MQLAERLQTSQPQVAKIESGKVDPQYSTLVKLGAALDLDPNALFRLSKLKQPAKGIQINEPLCLCHLL